MSENELSADAKQLLELHSLRVQIAINQTFEKLNDRIAAAQTETRHQLDNIQEQQHQLGIKVAQIGTRLEEGDKRMASLEVRVEKLEEDSKAQAKKTAFGAGLAFAGGGVGAALAKVLMN